MTPYREEANLGVLRHITTGQRVLDVGCGRGRLGMEIRERGNIVHGIEIDADAARVAATRLDHVQCGDVTNASARSPQIQDGNYDLIVLADVLEHLVDPRKVLTSVGSLLAPEGRIIVSLPNVANWSVRFRLMAGDFTYSDAGILDRTHLRFFTRRTARALLEECGYQVCESDVTPSLVRSTLPLLGRLMPAGGSDDPTALVESPAYRFYVKWIEPVEAGVTRLWPELLAFQHVLVGVRK